MKKQKYLAPEIETMFLTYEDLMNTLSFEGSAPDSEDDFEFPIGGRS